MSVRGGDSRTTGRTRGTSRLAKPAAVGLLTALLGLLLAIVPPGLDLEEDLGLYLLFKLRGERPAPRDVVVVSIDRASAQVLDLPGDPAKWPRFLHARLVNALSKAGAAAVAFDLFFESPRVEAEDREFATEMVRAGNVVLAEYLGRETLAVDHPGATAGVATVERLAAPFPLLAEAAAASAPFPLPKIPVRVNQVWTFKAAAGDIPTLPVVVLQMFAGDAVAEFAALLERVARVPASARDGPPLPRAVGLERSLERSMTALRERFAADPGLADRMLEALRKGTIPPRDPRRAALLAALVEAYRSPDSRYLDFYGPARTITTIPYHEVLTGEGAGTTVDLRGKAVFVGISEQLRPEQKDTFYTVFSRPAGVDLSGVEIAATAFANLLERRSVEPLGLPGHLGIPLLFGALLGAVCAALSPTGAALAAVGAGVAYLAGAEAAFHARAVWFPVAVPLLFQVPAAFLTAVVWRYAEANRDRARIRSAFSYYLPDRVVGEVLATLPGTTPGAREVYGICLATDAERYTTLAEGLSPADLADLMNRYYAAVFEPIRRNGGIVSDIVGDSALAIWGTPAPDCEVRARACRAACEIPAAVERFNASSHARRLPTRIGLHAGEMVLGHVGAMDHYEYRAVGDIVNAATRIQALNKRLGTRTLASEEVVQGCEEILTRKLGTFLLVGKSRPIVVYELVCPKAIATPRQVRSSTLFAEALSAYEARAWQDAREKFRAVIAEAGDDDVSRFYAQSCERHRSSPPDGDWTAVIRMGEQ